MISWVTPFENPKLLCFRSKLPCGSVLPENLSIKQEEVESYLLVDFQLTGGNALHTPQPLSALTLQRLTRF